MTRLWKFATIALAYLAATCLDLELRAELKPEEIYAAVLPSALTLEVQNTAWKHFVGSAFLALADGLAVTAWHVIADAQRVDARFPDDHCVKVAGVVDKDERLDLALIKLETAHRPQLRLNLAPPLIGSRVYVLGTPRGFAFSFGDGLVSQIRTVDGVRYYQVSCPISPGDSGGPVLNERGEAIAVIAWRKADAENVSFAVPGAELTRLNTMHAPAAWPLGSIPAISGNQASLSPLVRMDVPTNGQLQPNQFVKFQRFLADHAGKQLSVTVQEPDKETRFTFEVPRASTNLLTNSSTR
jgi:hypothetical protein